MSDEHSTEYCTAFEGLNLKTYAREFLASTVTNKFRYKVGRVTPCAPQPANRFPKGRRGLTRPTRAPQDESKPLCRFCFVISDKNRDECAGIMAGQSDAKPPSTGEKIMTTNSNPNCRSLNC